MGEKIKFIQGRTMMLANRNTFRFKGLLIGILLLGPLCSFGQQTSNEKTMKKSRVLMQDAEEALANNNFPMAEAYYRRAIAKDSGNVAARYNLGNLYFNNKIITEARQRHGQAAKSSTTKSLKHKAYHNKGNAFMEQKQYKKAIEAYKNALRNNPEDDQTRYNLALAKKMLEEEKKNGGGGGNDSQNQDQGQQKKDKQQGEGKNQESDQGKPKNQNKGENNKNKKEGDKDQQDKGQPKDKQGDNKPNEKGQEQQQQQKPIPGQLSPQQIKNLLEAMSNEEEKVRKKINARKSKGEEVRTEKDW